MRLANLIFFPTSLPFLQNGNSELVAGKNFSERSAAFIKDLAVSKISGLDFPKVAMPVYTTRLVCGLDQAETLAAVDHMMGSVLKEKRQDPFDLQGVMHGCLICPDKYPTPLVAKISQYAAGWKYTKPIGVSLNYDISNP